MLSVVSVALHAVVLVVVDIVVVGTAVAFDIAVVSDTVAVDTVGLEDTEMIKDEF